jgi:hypothetical protein
VGRTAACPVCGADARCCKNCGYYAPGSKYDCHETVDELVSDKERANFCDAFTLSAGGGDGKAFDKAKQARSAFDSLFT